MTNLPYMMTVKEFRQLLRIGRKQVYDLIHEPGFPKLKIRGTYRIPRDEALEYLKERS